MTLVDMVGFSAAAGSLSGVFREDDDPLRIAAICSNVLFIAFGLLSGFWPSALLHTLLLPLNFPSFASDAPLGPPHRRCRAVRRL